MSLYIDKYYPKTFDEIKFNYDVAEKLKKFSKYNNISHIILSGAKGSGKNTFANLYINYKYNKGKPIIKHTKKIIINSKTNVAKDIRLIYSDYHLQLNPSLHGVYDRLIIKEYINDIIKTKSSLNNYITIIIEDADKLTIDAQESLRRTLEKYMSTCRFIFLVDQLSNVIEPLLSRFVLFRLSLPSKSQIYDILNYVHNDVDISLKKNCINDEKDENKSISKVFNDIIEISNRNLKESINLLNLYHVFGTIIDSESEKICEILSLIKNNFTPKSIDDLRIIIYDLLTHCIEPTTISKLLFKKIVETESLNDIQYEKLTLGLMECNDDLKTCNKPIYYLERFVLYIVITLYV